MYHYISTLCAIRIYLALYVLDLGRKKKEESKMYLFDCQYSLSLPSSVYLLSALSYHTTLSLSGYNSRVSV